MEGYCLFDIFVIHFFEIHLKTMPKKKIDSAADFSVIEDIPSVLPVLPLRDNVIFPYMIYPVLVGRPQSVKAAEYALGTSNYIFLSSQKKPLVEDPGEEDIYKYGTIAKIIQMLRLPNGLMKILIDGLIQGRIVSVTDNKNFIEAEVEVIIQKAENASEIDALVRKMSAQFKEYVKTNKNIPEEALSGYNNIEETDRKLFYISANLNQTIQVKQSILQKITLKEQIYKVIEILTSEIDILKLEKEIEGKVHENISRNQRRFIIQEQIRVLKEELGDSEDYGNEFDEIYHKLTKLKLPENARERAEEELNKLTKTPPNSPEYTVIRNYLDWIIGVPWHKQTKDNLDIGNVRKILDAEHYGLEKPKERIVEQMAVLNLVKEIKGQILCFVGPPGVGKTSLGQSIAKALGRKFVRISLGGVKDEAEIRGHRRTYIGSMPGKIIQAMKKAKTVNPVILLDEIDKMSMDFRGDPSSAMLEVLDPEQNSTFNDHYLDMDYDLSRVMFITTANVQYNIPLPLLDRMEIIELPGYLEHEKLEIAKKHILPKQIKLHGLKNFKIKFTDEAVLKIITDYTRESGVRNLEREIAGVCRKVASEIVSAGSVFKKTQGLKVTPEKIEEYLKMPKYRNLKANETSLVGSVTGLAWTRVGGQILQVEATVMNGSEKLTLTGKIGDVMKESAQAALSFLRSNAEEFGLEPDFHKNKEIHIHIPEGAIPKDGPSAGITMTMALYSAFSGKPADSTIAMTGEITLRGKILAIGGLTEKLIAARASGIKTVLIPKENERDLSEMKDTVKDGLKIIPVTHAREALNILFPNNSTNDNITERKNDGRQSDN